jgi:hypothetical protein
MWQSEALGHRADEAAEDPTVCGARTEKLPHRMRMNPTCRSINRRVEAHAVSDWGVLGGDLTVITGSIRWTGNLPDRADVAAHGGAGAARGQMATTSRGVWKLRIG